MKLQLIDLSFQLHLGVTPQERAQKQEVRISVELTFARLPDAIHSDQIQDTVCYGTLSELIRGKVENQAFATVERLAAVVGDQVDSFVAGRATWRLRVHKVTPPVPYLFGGVVVELESDVRWRQSLSV